MSAVSVPQATPFLVVFGRDQAGKPHASWFDQASAELATKAAALMNMHAVPVDTDALRELAGSLPRGRVFSSGRAFTPFIKSKLYGHLVELTRELLGLSHSEAADANAPPPQVMMPARPRSRMTARQRRATRRSRPARTMLRPRARPPHRWRRASGRRSLTRSASAAWCSPWPGRTKAGGKPK